MLGSNNKAMDAGYRIRSHFVSCPILATAQTTNIVSAVASNFFDSTDNSAITDIIKAFLSSTPRRYRNCCGQRCNRTCRSYNRR
jgi:hypothetical protein